MTPLWKLLSPDAVLVRQALADSPGALEALVLRYQRKAHAVARALGVRPDAADDVVQEAFLQSIVGLTRLRSPAAFGPWFLQIVRNLSRKHIQVSQGEHPCQLEDLSTIQTDPAGSEEDARELSELVDREVRRLPESLREAIFLYYYDGESVRRVAQALSLSTSAVKSRLKRAREALRGRLWRELEESFRRVVPSTRKWTRGGRRLALFLGAAALPQAGGASLARATVAPAVKNTLKVSLGMLLMKANKSFVIAVLSLLLFSGGLVLLSLQYGRKSSPENSAPLESPSQTAASHPRGASGAVETPVAGGADTLPPGEKPSDSAAEATNARYALVGFVADEEGSAIPEAAVGLECLERPPLEDGRRPEIEGTSDKEGAFRFGDLEGGRYRVWAKRFDHGYASEPVLLRETRTVVITLKPAAHVVGRAYLYDRSRPLPDAELVYGEGTGVAGNGSYSRQNKVRTDSEGRFVLGPWDFTDRHLHFRYESYLGVSRYVQLSRGKPGAEVEVIFVDGITVRGKVENQGGDPLPSYTLIWGKPNTHEACHLEVMTGADGRYEVQGLEPGLHVVYSQGVATALFKTRTVTLKEDRIQEVPFVVDCPSPLRIRVLSDTLKPVEGVEVQFKYQLKHIGGGGLTTPTDSEGWTALSGVPSGVELKLEVEDPERGSAKLTYLTTEASPPAVLILESLQLLEGRVADEKGQPVAGCPLVALGQEQRVGWATSDASGRFEMKLLPGEYALAANAGAAGAALMEGVTVPAGKAPEPVQVVIETEGSIRVHVLGLDGEPAENASVLFEPDASAPGPWSRQTDAKGWLAASVGAGEHTVRATYGTLCSETVGPVRPGGEPVGLRLQPEVKRAVSGQVLRDGKPVPFARVGVDRGWWIGGLAPRETCDALGRFTLAPECDEEFRVVAWGPDFAFAASDPVRMPDEGSLDGIVVNALQGADATIVVQDSDGAPVPRASVDIHGIQSPRLRYKGIADESGNLRIPRLPLREYQIYLTSVDARLAKHSSFEWTGSEPTVEFRLKRE
jgi:RNA polymerase sigma-70 factor (ECF subfamily)